MKKQKICIIGGSLTGLVTAVSLSKLNCEIDLVISNQNQSQKSNRTIALSEYNYNFLKKLNIFDSSNQHIWPCSKMQLYSTHKDEKFSKIFELNNENLEKKILYMIENSKIIKLMINKIKKIKSISIKLNKKISKIHKGELLQSVKYDYNSSKYNLIIICTGNNSDLVKNSFQKDFIETSYKEKSVSTIIKHHYSNNNTVRQFFFDNEILALLPISNNKTSIVWSVKNNIYKKNEIFIKQKIKHYTKEYLKNIKFITKIEFRDLNFLIRKNYYQDRTLLFGDALHVVHPLVGQGFNMTLRDLLVLENILKNKISLGLDIGSQDVLSEFSKVMKPRNFVYAYGIDFVKNIFSLNSMPLKNLRNNSIKTLNKNNLLKNIFFDVADKGLRF